MIILLREIIQGILTGIAVAAPIGPVAFNIIRRSLLHGRVYGYISGLAASLVNAFFASIALLSLHTIIPLFVSYQWLLHLIGGSILVLLGIKTACFFSQSKTIRVKMDGEEHRDIVRTFLAALPLSFANPLTILTIFTIFLGEQQGHPFQRNGLTIVLLILGIFLGTASWWLLISSGISFLRRFWIHHQNWLTPWINRISGGMIAVFGMLLVLR